MIKTVFDINIDFSKSSGSYLHDRNTNRKFLDLFSMFSSLPLGYNHPIFDKDFDEEVNPISRIRMSNNLFYSDELMDFQNRFSSISFHDNLHLCSTGALAVESALKCAFEYSKKPDSIILGLRNSYHGINCWGFITDATMPSVSQRVKNFPKNNWKNLELRDIAVEIKKSKKNNISAVIVEPIQCTAGDIYLNAKILKEIEELCKSNNICFIVDEIQTGFGVTGDYWYSESINLNPDIVIFGKKSQICGVMVNNKYSEAIKSKYRKLEVTFDGDLIDAIRCKYIIDAIEKNSLLSAVKKNSLILREDLMSSFDNYRSVGHLVDFDFPSKSLRDNFASKAHSNYLLVNPTGEKSVRLRPNLAFSANEIDELLVKIKKIKR